MQMQTLLPCNCCLGSLAQTHVLERPRMIQGDGGGLKAAAAAAQGEEALRQASQGGRSRDPRRSRLRPSLCCSLNLFFHWRSQRGQVPPHARPQQRGVQEVPPEQEEEAGACAKQFFHSFKYA